MTKTSTKPPTYLETQIAKVIEEALSNSHADIPMAAAHYASEIKRLAATPGR
jgi:hypothetical protein